MKHLLFQHTVTKSILAEILIAAVFAACADTTADYLETGEAEQYVTITITIPGAQAPSTRSIAEGNGEAAVNSIDVLVFQKASVGADETLSQHVKGEIINRSASKDERYKVQFKAKLYANTKATSVAIVANASNNVTAAATVGSTKAAVLTAMTYASSGASGEGYKWQTTNSENFTHIPMYGEYLTTSGITPSMKIEDVELIRMLARIDVTSEDNGFMLKEVHVVNYRTAGYIAPSWTTQKPMIPTSSQHKTGEANAMKYNYTAPLVGDIYTYEAPATTGIEGTAGHTDAICLVVLAEYAGRDYYYRIDFTDTESNYLPVLRNHLYHFTINTAGIGHDTFEDALRSRGVTNNLKISLLVVDESSINHFVFNGEHFLGVAPLEPFSYEASTTDLLVTTNYTYGWRVDRIEYESDVTGWLTAVKQNISDVKRCNLQLTTTAYVMGNPERTAYVYLKAGRLEYKVTVVQQR